MPILKEGESMGLIRLLQSMTTQEAREAQNTNNNYRESELSSKISSSEKDAVGGVATLDADKKVVQNPASTGKAGGIMALPATLPITGAMLKMGANGTVVTAVDGTDYGMRITQLWSGFQTTTGAITLLQPITNFKVVVLEMVYNNNPVQGINENIYFPTTIGTGSQFPFCHAFGTIRYLICTMSGTSINISDVSALNGSGLLKVFGIK